MHLLEDRLSSHTSLHNPLLDVGPNHFSLRSYYVGMSQVCEVFSPQINAGLETNSHQISKRARKNNRQSLLLLRPCSFIVIFKLFSNMLSSSRPFLWVPSRAQTPTPRTIRRGHGGSSQHCASAQYRHTRSDESYMSYLNFSSVKSLTVSIVSRKCGTSCSQFKTMPENTFITCLSSKNFVNWLSLPAQLCEKQESFLDMTQSPPTSA